MTDNVLRRRMAWTRISTPVSESCTACVGANYNKGNMILSYNRVKRSQSVCRIIEMPTQVV